jgi:nucleosome binding factor SPN SPT16 subunit
MQYPPLEDPSAIWVKELTLKCKSTGANNRLSTASRQIKEMMKNVKTMETQNEMKANANASSNGPLENLTMSKSGRKEQLDNLVIRPNIVGKKCTGNLEIH